MREPLVPVDATELMREMERCAINAVLVENMVSVNHSFVRGNRENIETCAAHPRMYPLATCPPTYRWETPEGAYYLAAQLDSGAKGMLLRPSPLRHDLDPAALEPSADMLRERGLPLLLTAEDTAVLDGLRGILPAFPELNVVLLYASWGDLRRIFPLLDRFPNLIVDLGANQANDIVDVIARNFGADRMVYSSGYPQRCTAGLKPLIEYSHLSEADKDLVAHGNACRIFKIDRAELKPYDICHMDDMEKAITEGKPLTSWPVYDIHAHVVDAVDTTTGMMMWSTDFDSIAAKSTRLGIDKVAFSSWEGLYGGGARANGTVYQAMLKYPDKFIGYATANPGYQGDLEDAINCHETKGFLGLKPYCQAQGRRFNDPEYTPWYEYGNSRRLFVLVHSGDQATADQIDEVAPLYPDLTFLMAHSGAGWPAARTNLALARKHGNVMLELTYTAMTRGVVEYFVQEIGSERVFFGTDMPMRDPGPQLAWVVFAEIAFEDKLNILGRNMQRLLDRALPPKHEPIGCRQ